MALDATVGGSNSNSYATEVAATAYLTSERLYVTAWTSATVPTREQALIWATLLIDSSFEFDGYKLSSGQALRWPRDGALNADGEDIDSSTIPALIFKATCILALYLITSNRLTDPAIAGLGLKEAKVGPIHVVIDSNETKEIIPNEIILLLAPLGWIKNQAQGKAGVVTLRRG